MRLFTENKDYIVIGMAYLPAPPAGPGGGITPEQQKDHIARELAAYRRVRDWAVAHAHADPNRLFLSGGSKGGWTVSYLADQEIGRLAGLVIALSGRQRTALNPPPAGAYRDKPVYIGVGETDGNLLPALQARSVYARFGARVSFEEYTGVGHQVPQKAERLSLWLRAHGHYAHPWTPDSERAQLKETFRAEYQAAMAEKDAARRQARLLAIAEDPRLPLCGDSVYRGVLAQLDSVRQDPANRDAWNAEASFDRLCWQEWNIRFLNDMKAVCEGFQQVSQRYRDTLYGKRAGKFYERVAPVYAKMQEDVKKATEEAAKKAPPKKNIAVDFPGVSFGR
jgi:dienelactone hydrolase